MEKILFIEKIYVLFSSMTIIIPFLAIPPGCIYPPNQVAYTGSTVFITCGSVLRPTWSKDGQNLKGDFILRESLLLRKVTPAYSGVYSCIGTLDEHGLLFQNFSELLVGGRY